MKQNNNFNSEIQPANRVHQGLKMTGTLLALSTVAVPMGNAEEGTEDQNSEGDGTALPKLVVTADANKSTYKTEKLSNQKYVLPLRDVPQTVTSIPKEVFQEQGATTLTEILRNVPGITMAGGENGNAGATGGDAFLLRGFNASNSIFMDGVRDDTLVSRDSFNTESVDVFQGPTGSDVGRTNAAGYINMQTKMPHLANSYQGGVLYNSGGRGRYTMDFNQDLSTVPEFGPWTSGMAVRLNALFQDGGIDGRDIAENNIWGLAPSLAWGLGTDTRAFLSYQHIEQRNIPDYGLPANRNRLAPGANHKWFYGTDDDYDDSDQDTFTARFEYDINEHLTLTNQTRYNTTTRDTMGVRAAYSLTPGPNFEKVTRTFVADNRENSIFSNQTNFTAKFDTAGLKHTLVTGFEYTREDQDTYGMVGGGSFAPISPGTKPDNNLPAGFVPFTRGPGFSKGETETIGLYAFDTIDLSPKWILTGGVRMDHYDTTFTSFAIPRGGSAYVRNGPFGVNDQVYSGKIGLVYKPVEDGSIYASYGRSAQPPGTGNFSLTGADTSVSGVNTDPQISENFEIGTKWDLLESRLSLTGAAFYTENTNFIYQDDPGPPATYSTDGGQQIFGLAVGATGRITDNWSVFGSITYLDGEVNQSGNASDGNRLARTPDWSASLWTTYKLPKGFTVGLGMRAQNSVATSTADGAPSMAGYAVFDGMVQYDVNENVNLRLNVYNLLNTDYVSSTSGGGGGDPGGTGGSIGSGIDISGNRILYGAPLSVSVSANFKF